MGSAPLYFTKNGVSVHPLDAAERSKSAGTGRARNPALEKEMQEMKRYRSFIYLIAFHKSEVF
jgi:hypothetical protein